MDRVCRQCRKSIEHKNSQAVYCDNKCKSKWFYARNRESQLTIAKERYQAKKEGSPPKLVEYRKGVCELCQSEFPILRRNMTYCSKDCRINANSVRNKDKIKEASLRYYERNRQKVISRQKARQKKNYPARRDVYRARSLEYYRNNRTAILSKRRSQRSAILYGEYAEAHIALLALKKELTSMGGRYEA